MSYDFPIIFLVFIPTPYLWLVNFPFIVDVPWFSHIFPRIFPCCHWVDSLTRSTTRPQSSKVFAKRMKSLARRWISTTCSRRSPGRLGVDFSGRLWVADCFERVSDVLLVVGSISDGFFNGLIFVFGMSLVVVSHGFWWVFLAAGRSREWGQTYA